MKMTESDGFTLLEMMIVVAIVGAAILIIPALGTWMGRQGVSLAVDHLRADIQLARMMAIKQQGRCTITANRPGRDQYMNSLSRQWVYLSQFRGGVHFMEKGPDGRLAASEIVFNRQGMSCSAVPRDFFLADADYSSIFRIRILLPGGISIHRWSKDRWY